MKPAFAVVFFNVALAVAAPNLNTSSVLDFGAKGDGKTDDTVAFQKALDAAGKEGGGTVIAPRGNYFFAGHLNVPNAVALKGMWESVPSHVGIRNSELPKPTDDGTTFLVTENRGKCGVTAWPAMSARFRRFTQAKSRSCSAATGWPNRFRT